MRVTRQIGCCGIREIDGLEYARDCKYALHEFLHRTKRNRLFRFAIFSESNFTWNYHHGMTDYGQKLAAYIKQHKLGKVTKSNTAQNPNSGNNVTVWIWSVDWDALKKWAADNPVPLGTNFGRIY